MIDHYFIPLSRLRRSSFPVQPKSTIPPPSSCCFFTSSFTSFTPHLIHLFLSYFNPVENFHPEGTLYVSSILHFSLPFCLLSLSQTNNRNLNPLKPNEK
jgi:hydroxyacyl-ACP dehydratase HTD2-like protein with hotdog domain